MLLAVQLIRAATLGAAAIVLALGGPAAPVFLLAVLTSVAGAAYRPSHLAVVPVLARTPQELVATNVSASTFEGIAVLVGPALAAILLTFSGVDVVLAVSAAISLWAAWQVSQLSHSPHLPAAGHGAVADMLAGARALAVAPGPRLVIGLFASQAFVRGILNVLLVVTAFRLLHTDDSGVGLLNAAFGAGGLAGGLLGLGLVGLRRLARPFAAGLVIWGAPLALIAAWPHELVGAHVPGRRRRGERDPRRVGLHAHPARDRRRRPRPRLRRLRDAGRGRGRHRVDRRLAPRRPVGRALRAGRRRVPAAVPGRGELPAAAADRRRVRRAAARAGGAGGPAAVQPAAGDDAGTSRRAPRPREGTGGHRDRPGRRRGRPLLRGRGGHRRGRAGRARTWRRWAKWSTSERSRCSGTSRAWRPAAPRPTWSSTRSSASASCRRSRATTMSAAEAESVTERAARRARGGHEVGVTGGDQMYGVVVVTGTKPSRCRIGLLSSEASVSR